MFGKSNQRVGLDIGTHSIKIVVLDKAGGRFRPTKVVQQDIYPELRNYDPEGPRRSVAVPALSDAFKQTGINPRKIRHLYSSIGGAQISAKEILTIHLDDEEMASAMLLEARKHIPLDGSSTLIDYQILGEHPKEADKVRVLIAATTTKLFESHAEILRDLEMKPGVVDLDQLAAINSYIVYHELPDEGVAIFLNAGARKTNLTVVGRTDLFFTREIQIAGHVFTEELMKKYGLEYSEAEKVKFEQGMEPDLEIKAEEGDASGFRVAAKNALNRFVDEINRSLRYYVKESGQSFFNRIILTGGSSALKELDKKLEEKFNLPVTIYDPFEDIGDSANGYYGPQFAVAYGLAMRGD